MRRGIAIILALVFGLGPLAAALPGSDDARLPACCRRLGAHHCAMPDALLAHLIEASSSGPMLTAPAHCPLFPASGYATVPPIHALTPAAKMLPILLAHKQTPHATDAASPASQSRAQADRGPPSILG